MMKKICVTEFSSMGGNNYVIIESADLPLGKIGAMRILEVDPVVAEGLLTAQASSIRLQLQLQDLFLGKSK